MKNMLLEQDIEKFCKNLNIKYQVDFVEKYAKIGDSVLHGGKHCGSDAEHEGSHFIANKLEEIGLKNVELISCKTSRYQFNDATLKIKGNEYEIKPYAYVSPGTDGEIEVELIDIGKATKDECANFCIEGKAVIFAAMGTLEGGNLAGQMEEAIIHGAKAIIIYAVEDVLNDDTIRVQPPNIISSVPIVGICRKDAEILKTEIEKNKCLISLTVDAEYIPDGGITYNVVGEIPGMVSEEKIIYTAHLDHYFRCLQDNIASCSTLLGIAKSIIDSNITPNRSIVFAFHGSHETGNQDSRYPYIYGSYKLTHESKPEWTGSAIMNINFEYTALHQSVFQMTAYMGSNKTVQNYFEYAPKLLGGFDKQNKNAPQTEYYMLSWSDSISYLSAGIPTICNDPISEQFYEGKGPYVGRDHSNYDNWEVFNKRTLEDNGRMYGGLGLFIDNMPYIMLDYSEQTNRIRSEIDVELLKKLGLYTEEYMETVNRLDEVANKINMDILQKNTAYIEALNKGLSQNEIRKWFAEARATNKKLLHAYEIITKKLDKINQFDFLCLGTVKYLQNIQLMQNAEEYIKSGDIDKILPECLASVDLCMSSFFFSESVVEHMRKQICEPSFVDRRTWAAARELNISTHYNLVQTFVKEMNGGENNFSATIKNLENAIAVEKTFIPAAISQEIQTIREATKILEEI